LTDQKIYADGVVDCREHVALEQFAAKVHSGRVTTAPPDDARASAHHVASWTFVNPTSWVDQRG
jgi:hypothetical protein